MTLFDCRTNVVYTVAAIRGGDSEHRRLVDMGLLGSDVCVRIKKKRSVLADFGIGFTAAVERSAAEVIEVIEKHENRALR